MANLGDGNGSGYPSVIDTQEPPESAEKLARFNVPNDLASAILNVQKELGTDPAGSESTVKDFLLVEHNIDGTHSSSSLSLLHIQDQKLTTISAGTFTFGADRTRELNTVITNEIAGASLSSNQITLNAGTYYIDASVPANHVGPHRALLQNITAGVVLITGTSERSEQIVGQSGSVTRVFIQGRFTLSVQSELEIQHQCLKTQLDNGLGDAVGFGPHEVYTDVKIWKTVANIPAFTGLLLHIQDQKPTFTFGGTFFGGSDQTRDLTTVLINEIDGASLSSNQITLPAGSYYSEGISTSFLVIGHRVKLRNITEGIDIAIGLGGIDAVDSLVSSFASQFTLSVTSILEVQGRCLVTSADVGFGTPLGLSPHELYTDIRIWKVG